MTVQRIEKVLTANDVGKTGSHQAGIAVPKQPDLLSFFPALDARVKNPDVWIHCQDAGGTLWKVRFVYYNNKLHAPNGTRNEYRLTHITSLLKQQNAQIGDILTFTATSKPKRYLVALNHSKETSKSRNANPDVIKLTGWRRVH